MNRIKLLRNEFNISQEDLASKLGLSKGIISLYENADRNPSLEVLIKMSEIFNCSIDYIIGKSDKRNADIDFNPDLLQIGLSTKDYNITEDKKKQIEEFAKYVLKDNKKDKDNK